MIEDNVYVKTIFCNTVPLQIKTKLLSYFQTRTGAEGMKTYGKLFRKLQILQYVFSFRWNTQYDESVNKKIY